MLLPHPSIAAFYPAEAAARSSPLTFSGLHIQRPGADSFLRHQACQVGVLSSAGRGARFAALSGLMMDPLFAMSRDTFIGTGAGGRRGWRS